MSDVTVRARSLGEVDVRVDIGGGHALILMTSYRQDRFRDVRVRWLRPGVPTGATVAELRRYQPVLLAQALDLRTGEHHEGSAIWQPHGFQPPSRRSST